MASKSLKFRKIRFTHPWKRFKTNFHRDARDLPKAEAAFTRRRARSIMKKAPKKPAKRLGLYGRLQPYAERNRKGQRNKKFGQYYWKKGQYSRPGHPPFYHTDGFNLRFITFHRVNDQADIPHKRGGNTYAWRVGPKFKASKWNPTPIPQLHEYGGTVRWHKSRGMTYKGRNGVRFRRNPKRDPDNPDKGVLRYAERPYMRPAGKEARKSVRAKYGGSVKRLYKLGRVDRTLGITAKKKYASNI